MGSNFGARFPEDGPSPNFVHESQGIWDQNYLAKALLQIKDTEFVKLKFAMGSYRPYEYGRWIRAITMNMTALHPESGAYWLRVVASAESVYNKYLNDGSVTRVSLKPTEVLCRTDIEKS